MPPEAVRVVLLSLAVRRRVEAHPLSRHRGDAQELYHKKRAGEPERHRNGVLLVIRQRPVGEPVLDEPIVLLAAKELKVSAHIRIRGAQSLVRACVLEKSVRYLEEYSGRDRSASPRVAPRGRRHDSGEIAVRLHGVEDVLQPFLPETGHVVVLRHLLAGRLSVVAPAELLARRAVGRHIEEV